MVDGVDSQYKSDLQVSEDKREERKALVNEEIIILGLAVPLRFRERLMRESCCWRLVLLLGYTLQGLWSGLFHLSLSPCVEKKTWLREDPKPLSWKQFLLWGSDIWGVFISLFLQKPWVYRRRLTWGIYLVRSRGHFFHSMASTTPKATTTTTIRLLRTMFPTVHSWAAGPVMIKEKKPRPWRLPHVFSPDLSLPPLIWHRPGFTWKPCVENSEGLVRASTYAEAEVVVLLGGGRCLESILLTICEWIQGPTSLLALGER